MLHFRRALTVFDRHVQYFCSAVKHEKLQIPRTAPKKPLSGYFMFAADIRSSVVKEHPDLKMPDVSKIISAKWKELDFASKEKYLQRHRQALEIYHREKDDYLSSLNDYERNALEEAVIQKKVQLNQRKLAQHAQKRRLTESSRVIPNEQIAPNLTLSQVLHQSTASFPVKDVSGVESQLSSSILPTWNYSARVEGPIGTSGTEGLGRPIQILSADWDHRFTLNEHALAQLLLRDDVRELPVAIVSVAGAFRKGKSFLLDFFLRYMRSNGASNWMGNETEPLIGFKWRSGCERDTSGILLWNDVFKVHLRNGRQIAVLLMDTQGTFDSHSTVKDCATIFALSTMTSSTQVYNLSQNIQENDLQHLQLFTEYGRLAIEENAVMQGHPFQRLMVLVRDWQYPSDAPYGLTGGKKILDRRLEIHPNQHEELQQLRRHIRSCFSQIDCFLMPHPGLKVATSETFDGRLCDIEPDFKAQLRTLVPALLSPDNLTVKQIAGREITCRELLEYFKAYVAIFGGNELPEPKSMLEATAEANNLAAVVMAKDKYHIAMERICGSSKPYMSPKHLKEHHIILRNKSEEAFRETRKMGGSDFSDKYLKRLLEEIEESYQKFVEQNDNKSMFRNIYSAAKTPVYLLSSVASFYVLSGFFGLFGLWPVAAFFNLCTGVSLMALMAWVYVHYSGTMHQVAYYIDQFANILWSKCLKPMYKGVVYDLRPTAKNLLRRVIPSSSATSTTTPTVPKKRE